MRAIRIYAITFVLCSLVLWAVGSFVAWDFDPSQWNAFARLAVGALAVCMSGGITGCVLDESA